MVKRKYDKTFWQVGPERVKLLRAVQAIKKAEEREIIRIEKEKRRIERREEKCCNVIEKQKEKRHKFREALLPQNRTCPECHKIFIRSKQWIIIDGVARCVGCSRKRRKTNANVGAALV